MFFYCDSAFAQAPCYGELEACAAPASQFTCAGMQCYWGEESDYTCEDVNLLGILDAVYVCLKNGEDPVYEAVRIDPDGTNCVETAETLTTSERMQIGLVPCYRKRLCKSECVTLSEILTTITITCPSPPPLPPSAMVAIVLKSRCQSDEGGLQSTITSKDELPNGQIMLYVCGFDECEEE
jgi:hypothetical protein